MSDPFQKRDLSQPKNFSLGNLKSFGILILSKEFRDRQNRKESLKRKCHHLGRNKASENLTCCDWRR